MRGTFVRRRHIVRIAASLGLCLGLQAQAQQEKTLTLALARNAITPGEETFTYAVPKQMGWFKREGLSVGLLKANGSTAALQAVASGSADIAYASSLSIAAAIDKGVPVKAFAGITVQWPYFIGVPPGSAIKKIADLKGKRVGVISLASASYADLRANLKIAGLTEADVSVVPVGAGARAAAALKANEVDAIDSYSDSFTVMQQNGVNLTLLPRPPQMARLFSVTMVTSAAMLKSNPDALARFARAAYQGIVYTQQNPEAALKLSFQEFPELAGSANPGGPDAKNTLAAMKIALGDSIPSGNADPKTWGHWLDIDATRWEALLAFAHETGQTEKRLTPAQVWDGSLMKTIFDFDLGKVR
ncbi:ABC transporter substrate-binding protein [Ideonella sp. A 288]|uniref:ABC transporter substrate-binding protein n=1 Tax=Ideonella sp. A 288 TaxID=1962181 RepID=UPI001302EBF5|nr:ABC transporter substrate-binding protein [Ideonella sp. A 288]